MFPLLRFHSLKELELCRKKDLAIIISHITLKYFIRSPKPHACMVRLSTSTRHNKLATVYNTRERNHTQKKKVAENREYMLDPHLHAASNLHLFGAILVAVLDWLHIIHLHGISIRHVGGPFALVVPVYRVQDQLRCPQRTPAAVRHLRCACANLRAIDSI